MKKPIFKLALTIDFSIMPLHQRGAGIRKMWQ